MADKLDRHRRTSVQQAQAVLTPNEVKALLHELCIQMGFCLKPEESQRLMQSPPTDVIDFSRAVFAAEGLDPDYADRQLFQDLNNLVHRAFLKHLAVNEV